MSLLCREKYKILFLHFLWVFYGMPKNKLEVFDTNMHMVIGRDWSLNRLQWQYHCNLNEGISVLAYSKAPKTTSAEISYFFIPTFTWNMNYLAKSTKPQLWEKNISDTFLSKSFETFPSHTQNAIIGRTLCMQCNFCWMYS